MVRKDHPDLVFLNRQAKFKAVLEDIQDCHQRGQPVLVGTTSIETSEMLSNQLREAGVTHEVLTAKTHEREAQIVAQAGLPKEWHLPHKQHRNTTFGGRVCPNRSD